MHIERYVCIYYNIYTMHAREEALEFKRLTDLKEET